MFESGRIYIVIEPVSWRYRINGLTTYLSALYDVTPQTGDWFIVMNKRCTAVRTLHYTEQYVELYERLLIDGRFPQLIAEAAQGLTELNRSELDALLSGQVGKIKLTRG